MDRPPWAAGLLRDVVHPESYFRAGYLIHSYTGPAAAGGHDWSKYESRLADDVNHACKQSSIVQAHEKGEGVPKLDPIDDMKITNKKFVAPVNSLKSLKRKLAQNEVSKVKGVDAALSAIQQKAGLRARAAALRARLRESLLEVYRMELGHR